MPDRSQRASAYYSAPVDEFIATDEQRVLGVLAAAHSHDLEVEQRQAWEDEIAILKSALGQVVGHLYLEFDVPRLGSRIDAVSRLRARNLSSRVQVRRTSVPPGRLQPGVGLRVRSEELSRSESRRSYSPRPRRHSG